MKLPATLNLAEAAGRDWGAVVIGAGPAGALVAREAARRGVQVLLVERSDFPRWKVCGCCLNARALAVLCSVGLGELAPACGAVPLGELHLAVAGAASRLPLPGGMALSRQAFDTALVRAAIAAGADFLPHTCAALAGDPPGEPGHRRVLLSQGAEEVIVAGRVVLAAAGLGSNLLARAGVGAAAAVPGSRIGAGAIVAADDDCYRPGTIFMASGRGGYVGLVRLESGLLAVAGALDVAAVRAAGGPGTLACRLIAEVGWPVPAQLPAAAWRGTAALTRRANRLAAHRLLVLGDAAGYVEPFTGEGMAWALASAAAAAPLAVRAVERWQPGLARAWARRHRRLVTGRLFVCQAMAAALRRPLLMRVLVGVLARLPALAGPFVRAVNASA